jgi:predicted nucleotidyltransferase
MNAFPQNTQSKIDHNRPVPLEAIHAVAQKIAEKFGPEKIILFGSHAYGTPQASSDVDLLVVMQTELTPHKQRLQIARALSPRPFGMDILVRTPADLERRIALGDFFLREVVRKGKVIYERSN